MTKHRIAVLASGSGSNAEEIFKYFSNHSHIEVVLLLSNNPAAKVLERAQRYNVPALVFSKKDFVEEDTVLQWLREASVTHVVLAGFLWLIPSKLIKAFPDRIINIHPALLPKYGGKGMYGGKVHEAVKAAGEKETGITIHLVNERYDEGRIIFQGKCALDAECNAEEIAKRVHALEHANYPKVIEQWILHS